MLDLDFVLLFDLVFDLGFDFVHDGILNRASFGSQACGAKLGFSGFCIDLRRVAVEFRNFEVERPAWNLFGL